ncbi:uncharacterized protein LOC141515150 isoform X2 [Macrotis lagotis]|uniref:uncharacterized protein LOC141515150 isoform X2 n=1 Tax=Macrotis lagotis TaxID=92651 RepID=UPI003D686566
MNLEVANRKISDMEGRRVVENGYYSVRLSPSSPIPREGESGDARSSCPLRSSLGVRTEEIRTAGARTGTLETPPSEVKGHAGCPSGGPGHVRIPPPRRRRRRQKRRKRHNRTHRAQKMDKWLYFLGLLGSLQVTAGHPIPHLRVTNASAVGHYTYWTVIPGFPMALPATWSGDAIELKMSGSAQLVLGGDKEGVPEKTHRLNKTMTWRTKHLPICLTKGQHELCAQIKNDTIREIPHGPHGSLGHGDYLHFNMIFHNVSGKHTQVGLAWNHTYHYVVGGGCNNTNTTYSNKTDGPCSLKERLNAMGSFSFGDELLHSPLPPCTPSPNMFDMVQVCSTGHAVGGPSLNGTQVYFMDGFPEPYFAAPVPHILDNKTTGVQLHLWKAAAAFGNVTHMTDNSGPLTDNTTLRGWWWELLFGDKGYTCSEGEERGHCNTFTLKTQTVRDTDMFLVCLSANITQGDEQYEIQCANGTLTNTLKQDRIVSNDTKVFLMQVPPVTFLPVDTPEPFADSDYLLAVLKRPKRAVEVSALDIIGLVVSVIEQIEISAMTNQIHILAGDLQNFMQATAQAWTLQQQINREVAIELGALTSAVQALSTLVRVEMILEGLPCHRALQ